MATNFSTFSDGKSIKALHMRSRAETVPLAVARKLPAFALPVKLHDMWAALPVTPPAAAPDAKLVTPSWLGPELLPLMYIVELVDAGTEESGTEESGTEEGAADFRWRLFGTEHTTRYGAEATGLLMSEAASRDTSARDSLRFARQVHETGAPVFYLTEFFSDQGPAKQSHTVILPLAGPDGTVKRLFGCAAWTQA